VVHVHDCFDGLKEDARVPWLGTEEERQVSPPGLIIVALTILIILLHSALNLSSLKF
jgi:hypothetical protein